MFQFTSMYFRQYHIIISTEVYETELQEVTNNF